MSETSAKRRLDQKLARQRERTRQRITRILIPILAIALVGAGVAFLVLRDNNNATEITGLQRFADLSRNHVQGSVQYAQTPPVGGDHYASWQNCGAYETPVPNELAVHSLEHGAIWITYQPDLPPAQVNTLRALTRQHSYVLVSPFEGIPQPIVASAWGLQVQLETADDPRLQEFIRQYMQGPQTPEPGAPCSNGAGRPS